jgi:hypothetical protein
MSEIVSRAFRWGLLGLIFGPAATYSIMLAVIYLDPACQAGIAENCKLDPAVNLAIAAVSSFAAFFLISLIGGLVRRARGGSD